MAAIAHIGAVAVLQVVNPDFQEAGLLRGLGRGLAPRRVSLARGKHVLGRRIGRGKCGDRKLGRSERRGVFVMEQPAQQVVSRLRLRHWRRWGVDRLSRRGERALH